MHFLSQQACVVDLTVVINFDGSFFKCQKYVGDREIPSYSYKIVVPNRNSFKLTRYMEWNYLTNLRMDTINMDAYLLR